MNLKGALLAGAALALGTVFATGAAMAADISFSFADGPTSYFFGRDHVAGSYVSGVLYGLTDNATSSPTSVTFTHIDPALQFVGDTALNAYQWGGFGFTMAGGAIVDADFEFNMNDGVGNAFQLRLNGDGVPGANANWLFSNGGSSPVVGTGNTLGFAGATYGGGGAVPEPASWALTLVGFGGLGAVLRRARRNSTGLAAAA